jgi:hypothetical protein
VSADLIKQNIKITSSSIDVGVRGKQPLERSLARNADVNAAAGEFCVLDRINSDPTMAGHLGWASEPDLLLLTRNYIGGKRYLRRGNKTTSIESVRMVRRMMLRQSFSRRPVLDPQDNFPPTKKKKIKTLE